MAKAKKKKARPSTALAVRKPAARPREVVISGLPATGADLMHVGQLGELATVGALGLAEVKLTDKEESVLARPVQTADILIKPDGVPYIPHIIYTRWFNEAFGRTGWSIVPTSRPQKTGNLVAVSYLLYIHGRPVAYAMGEQDYHETNKRQTYGDAIESTVASALRRCAKRLGIGLELWDKSYLHRFKTDHCIAVKVQKQGEIKTEWRRKVDPSLPGEQGKRQTEPVADPWPAETVHEREAAGLPVLSSQPESAEVITLPQRDRMAKIAEKAGRKPSDVSLWLKQRWGVASSKAIKRSDYAEIVRQLEARGALSLPGDGQ